MFKRAHILLLLLPAVLMAVRLSAATPAELAQCPVSYRQLLEHHQVPAEVQRKEQQISAYVDGVYRRMVRHSKELQTEIDGARDGYVVDVLGIGAGPHMAIAAANVRAENPNARVLVAEMTDRFGTFHHTQGFDVNTREAPVQSGNTFPGAPIQPRDLNAQQVEYISAEKFGMVTVLAHHYAESNPLLNHRVVKVELAPPGSPAKYFVQLAEVNPEGGTEKIRKVYANHIIASTGLGVPTYRVADKDSGALIQRHLRENGLALSDADRRQEYAPGIQSVDNLLRLAKEDVAEGKNAMGRYGSGTFAVIGAGDGGNIAVEGITQLTHALNPNGLAGANHVYWVGQPALTGQAFHDGLPTQGKKDRYGRISKGYDDGLVEARPGYLQSVAEVMVPGPDGNPIKRFKLTYAENRDGSGKSEELVVDHVVFATGYENQILDVFSGLNPEHKPTLVPVRGNRGEYTTNDQLDPNTVIASRIQTGDVEHDIFLIGNANGQTPGGRKVAPEEWERSFGGFIDILAPLSAATGSRIGQQTRGAAHQDTRIDLTPTVFSQTKLEEARQTRPMQTGPTVKVAVEKDDGTQSVEELPASLVSQEFLLNPQSPPALLYNNLQATQLEAKVALAKMLSQFRFVNADVTLYLRFNRSESGLEVEVQGLSYESAKEIDKALEKDKRLLQLMDNLFSLGATDVFVGCPQRNHGTMRGEDLAVTVTMGSGQQ